MYNAIRATPDKAVEAMLNRPVTAAKPIGRRRRHTPAAERAQRQVHGEGRTPAGTVEERAGREPGSQEEGERVEHPLPPRPMTPKWPVIIRRVLGNLHHHDRTVGTRPPGPRTTNYYLEQVSCPPRTEAATRAVRAG
ncbi:hypothetical protein ACFU99_04085 [Streptomyces sp. NPDC057654]|uniref:hypothetical protein n=1 Tax=Streptomyces sp. NPDC057654 TaxID=3346196 RepID=UPI00369DF1FA